jgi:hypothetical protein
MRLRRSIDGDELGSAVGGADFEEAFKRLMSMPEAKRPQIRAAGSSHSTVGAEGRQRGVEGEAERGEGESPAVAEAAGEATQA